jgi:hypothetical protein
MKQCSGLLGYPRLKSLLMLPLSSKGKEIVGSRPNMLISDRTPNFNEAFIREFFTNKWPRTRHIKHIRLQGDHNNKKSRG